MSCRLFSFIHIFIILLLISCKDMFSSGDTKLIANAGPDQTTITGSYAILDASQSNGDIDWWDWEQDENNPAEVKIFSGDDNYKQQIGFTEVGIYIFRLTVRKGVVPGNLEGTQASEADEVVVTVNQNPQHLFEDPNLGIAVRFMLKKQTEELTENMLLSLDSLRFFDVVEDISSLSGLERCMNLRCLQMGHQNIPDISPIANLTKLKVLDLTQNRKISDITPLENLTELEWLNLDSNLITDISALKDLLKLEYLNLQYNSINDISVLLNMKELRELWMSHALLSDLSSLSHLSKLELLWLTGCGIEDISCLKNMANVKVLKLAWNQITDISSLSNMKKLEWVALEMNSISDISPLRELLNLRYVRLWDNQITDIKPLVDNPGIGEKDIVGLNDNPLNEKSINEYIPALQARGVVVTW